jgi:hypothetical protein
MKAESGKTYQLKLTALQREEIRELTGKATEAIELSVEQLEERILPGLSTN